MLVPHAVGDLVAGAFGAQGGDGGAKEQGHLGFGDFVAGDAVVGLVGWGCGGGGFRLGFVLHMGYLLGGC